MTLNQETTRDLTLAIHKLHLDGDRKTSKKSNGEAATTEKKYKKKKKAYTIAVNLSNCKYEVVRNVIKKKGWVEVDDDSEWELYWTDTSVGIERLLKLQRTQKINHFTGMLEICRKKSLCKNLANMAKRAPEEYNYVPKSFLLPEESEEFVHYLESKGKKAKKSTYIMKPDNGCQGKGIRLVQTSADASHALNLWDTANAVVQKYINKPFLINGLKFDLRVYALVTCCDPLRIFLYNEGLVRFCTEKYEAPSPDNLGVSCMHLTNYAVNKHNINFELEASTEDSIEGSKWSLKTFREWMESNGHDFEVLWKEIGDMIVKTVISVQPTLSYFYSSAFPADNDGLSCFEILGLDIMLDHKGKPWLIEVNHSPSFNTDSDLDRIVKEGLISDCINLVQVSGYRVKKAKAAEKKASKERLYSSRPSSSRKSMTKEEAQKRRQESMLSHEKYEKKHQGGFSKIFPVEDTGRQEKFSKLLECAYSNYKDSFHFKISNTLEKFKLSVIEKKAEKEKEEKLLKSKMARKLKRSKSIKADSTLANRTEEQSANDSSKDLSNDAKERDSELSTVSKIEEAIANREMQEREISCKTPMSAYNLSFASYDSTFAPKLYHAHYLNSGLYDYRRHSSYTDGFPKFQDITRKNSIHRAITSKDSEANGGNATLKKVLSGHERNIRHYRSNSEILTGEDMQYHTNNLKYQYGPGPNEIYSSENISVRRVLHPRYEQKPQVNLSISGTRL